MEIKNISKLNHDLCCGCESCAQKCPKHCISMIEKEDGFLYPQIDNSLCVNCGLCVKACPALSDEVAAKPYKAYALFNKDDDERRESSSGGVFISFAKRRIEEGGGVCGVVFDSRWMPHHVCAETLEDMRPMMGSKYVQSRTDKVYQECEVYLKSGRKVLFTGTPCQCSALHTFLRHKEYPNLLTIDVICHGVPSPGVWKEYLNETFGEQSSCRRQAADGKNTVLNSSLNAKSPIGDIKFRDKTDGWEKYRFVVRRKSAVKADKNSVLLSDMHRDNPFMKGSLSDIYLRPSCYNCPAKKGRSGSDIQMADFWGIREVDRKFYSSKGVSMLIVHTQKGMDFLNKMKGRIKQIDERVDLLNRSYSHCAIPHPRREEFFYRVDNEDLISVINELTKQKITERVYFYIRVCLKYFRINHFINKMKAKWERK